MRAATAVTLLALLAACAPSNATPTVSVEAIYTSAYQTMLAGQATQLALTPPTSAPTATLLPTLPPLPSPAVTFAFTSPTAGTVFGGGGSGACDSSAFVADVTIPDNTVIDAGKRFTKTWTLLNNGTCTWNSSYKLALSSGDAMGGVTTSVPGTVGPGSSLNISVNMVAPTDRGTYKGIWRLQNAAGQFFGDTPWVMIKVGTGATATAGPTPTAGPSPTANPAGTFVITVKATGIGVDFQLLVEDTHLTSSWGGVRQTCNNPCTFTVPSGWSGNLLPSKGQYVFTPSEKDLTHVTANTTVTFTVAPPPTP